MRLTAKVNIDSVLLFRERGKTYKEIADFYGTTDKYIKRLIHDAKDPEKLAKMQGKAAKDNAKQPGIIVPGTDMVIRNNEVALEETLKKYGDEKVGMFIGYHLDMMRMRLEDRVDKSDVNSLYNRFFTYLQYCMEHNIIPNNMSAYYAIGVEKGDISAWSNGSRGTPEHKQFALDVRGFFQSIHEQGGAEGFFNPVLTIWWQKAYDQMIEAQKVEAVDESPLGEKQDADAIAAKWQDVEMPD